MKNLILRAVVKYLAGFIILSALIFIPAGSLKFLNGWLFMGLLFIPMLIMGLVLIFKNPQLLEKRLNAKETQSQQKTVLIISGIMFISGFIIAGLNYRFKWYAFPKWVIILGSVIFILSYLMYAEVLRENTYLSRTVEVQENQKVIDTGLYGIVRHPMYSATIFLFLSIPLVLGSLYAFLIFLVYPFILILRIKNEEKVLENELDGYKEYKKKVKYRLFPFIW